MKEGKILDAGEFEEEEFVKLAEELKEILNRSQMSISLITAAIDAIERDALIELISDFEENNNLLLDFEEA